MQFRPSMKTTNDIEILLVEDNAQDAELGMRALKKRSLANRVTWVKDGAEALDYIFGAGGSNGRKLCHHPKVIFLDLKLPKVDGLTILRQLKGDAEARLIPVVVLTSSREEQDVIRSYELGVNSYIVKPMDFDKFSEAVSQLGLYWLRLNQPPEPASAKPNGGEQP